MTGAAPYPLFPLIEEEPATAREARDRLKRLLGLIDGRIAGLLAYFDLEPAGTAHATLQLASERAAIVLPTAQFHRPSQGPQPIELRGGTAMIDAGPELTSAGRSLAGDLGLLFARALLERAPEHLRWDVVTGSPRHVSFHRPVLRGFRGDVPLEPFRISTVCALKVLGGSGDGGCWTRSLDHWRLEIVEG